MEGERRNVQRNLMANPYLYGIPQRHLEHTFGRGMVVSDINGTYFISCYKHPNIRQPAVKVGLDQDVLTELEKAFDNCSGCVDEKRTAEQWANTRFPEGAEI